MAIKAVEKAVISLIDVCHWLAHLPVDDFNLSDPLCEFVQESYHNQLPNYYGLLVLNDANKSVQMVWLPSPSSGPDSTPHQ
jgi:hypothetical protein